MPLDNSALARILGELSDASDVFAIREIASRALNLCEVEGWYFIAPLSRDARVSRVLTNMHLPRVWERHYRARLHRIDPLPSLSLDYSNAFVWPDDIDDKRLDKSQARYLEIARRCGLGRGIGAACYGPHGRTGFLGAVWSGEGEIGEDIKLAIHQIGQASFQRYCHIVREDIEMPSLSSRELEVLHLMCRGKTNPQMAEDIGVSRSSIDSYIRRIFAKFGVSDRTAACMHAAAFGLTVSEEVERLVQAAKLRDRKALGHDEAPDNS